MKAPAPTPEPAHPLPDLDNWTEPLFGFTGEQIGNAMYFHRHINNNDWYRKHGLITLGKLKSEKFVTKMVEDAHGWKPPKPQPRIVANPDCGQCRGGGCDACRFMQMCECVKFRDQEGKEHSFWEWARREEPEWITKELGLTTKEEFNAYVAKANSHVG